MVIPSFMSQSKAAGWRRDAPTYFEPTETFYDLEAALLGKARQSR
jgi:hypothetical protein